MVIGTRIEYDGEDSVGLDTGSESVQGGLGEGDGDTTDTLICTVVASGLAEEKTYSRVGGGAAGRTTDSENGFAIGHDDEVD